MYCKSLEEIYIPDGVESVFWNAFYDCHKLKEITMSKAEYDKLSITSYDFIVKNKSFIKIISLENIIDKALDEGKPLKEINDLIKKYNAEYEK